MKTTFMLVASLLSVIGTSALAQSNAVSQVQADNAAIRHHTREVRGDRRVVHHDNAVIAAERHDLVHGRDVRKMDQQDARHDQRREDILVAKGDFRDARKLDEARRHELAGARVAARDVRHDRKQIGVARKDRAYDKAALTDQHAERRLEVARRAHDAANIR